MVLMNLPGKLSQSFPPCFPSLGNYYTSNRPEIAWMSLNCINGVSESLCPKVPLVRVVVSL